MVMVVVLAYQTRRYVPVTMAWPWVVCAICAANSNASVYHNAVVVVHSAR